MEAGKKAYFPEIDLCRGIGILLVVLGHALKQTGETNTVFQVLLSVIYSFTRSAVDTVFPCLDFDEAYLRILYSYYIYLAAAAFIVAVQYLIPLRFQQHCRGILLWDRQLRAFLPAADRSRLGIRPFVGGTADPGGDECPRRPVGPEIRNSNAPRH